MLGPVTGNNDSTSALPSWIKLLGHLPAFAALPLLASACCKLLCLVVVLPLVHSDVIGLPHKAQVLKPVVELVPIGVMNLVSSRDWAVRILPDAAMLKLVSVLPAFVPSKHPVSGLLVPARSLSRSPFTCGFAVS